MSVDATRYAHAVLLEAPDLARHSRAVLLALAGHADRDGLAWPGNDRLSALTGYDAGNVRRAALDLVDRGIIARELRGGRSTVYRFPVVSAVHTPRGTAHPTRAVPRASDDQGRAVARAGARGGAREGARYRATEREKKEEGKGACPLARLRACDESCPVCHGEGRAHGMVDCA